MEEFYRAIEEKIKESGYPGQISGRDIYEDVCDQIENQENGFYILLSKFSEEIVLEYVLQIGDEDFNLERIVIRAPEGEFTVVLDS